MSLGILTLLVMLFALPILANAQTQTAGYVNAYGSNQWDPIVAYEQQIVRVPAAQATQTYTNNPKNTTSTSTSTTTNTKNTTSNTANTNSDKTTDRYSNLAASAIYGGSSFAPSGLVQWIMLAILILVIIILARRIFGATDRYHKAPMKHA